MARLAILALDDPRTPSLTGFRRVTSGALRTGILLVAMLVCAALPMAADARPRTAGGRRPA
jgi:hypothetical protein